MNKKTIIKLSHISIVMFFAFVSYSLVFTQLIPYMDHLGLSPVLRGTVLAVSSLIGIVGQLFVGYLSDKYQRVKHFTILSHLLMIFFFAWALLFIGEKIKVIFIIIALAIGFYRISSNLFESWIYEIDEDTQEYYGVVRVFGSLGWAAGAFLVSLIISHYGYSAIGIAFVILMILDAILMMTIKSNRTNLTTMNLEKNSIGELFKNKQYVLIIIIFFWLFMIFNLNNFTVIERLIELNSQPEHIGSFWSVQATSEMVLMFFGGALISKFGGKKILIFTSLMIIIRFVLYGLATSANQIIVISLLQAVTFPFLLLTQKRMVAEKTPLRLRASGHMVMTAVTTNIPVIVTPLISGFLIQYVPIAFVLIGGGLSGIVPLLLSLFYREGKIDNSTDISYTD